MNYVLDFFNNYILMCAVIGWFAAQIIKIIICLFKNRTFSLMMFFSSGGMPSSHSATVCALTTAMGKTCGLYSAEFAISFIFAFIVMYDAAGVRRAAGEQAKIINKIVLDIAEGNTTYMQKNLKELIGHTPLEVFAGAILGILIPFIFKSI